MRIEDLERLTRDLEAGKTPVLGPEDTFTFVCDMCGRCCANTDILLSSYDLVRLRRHLGCTTTDLIRKGLVEVFPGGRSRLPLAMISFRPIGKDLTVCPFLAHVVDRDRLELRLGARKKPTLEDLEACRVPDRMACAVHPARPAVCRSSPLGRVTTFDPEAGKEPARAEQKVILVSPGPYCQGMKAAARVTVEEWLERNGVLPYWQASQGFQDLSVLMVDKGLRLPDEGSSLPEVARRALTRLWQMAAAVLYDFDAVEALASRFPQNRRREDFQEDLRLVACTQEMARELAELAAALRSEWGVDGDSIGRNRPPQE